MRAFTQCAFCVCLLLIALADRSGVTGFEYKPAVVFSNEARGLTVTFTAPTEFQVADIAIYLYGEGGCEVGYHKYPVEETFIGKKREVIPKGLNITLNFPYIPCKGNLNLQIIPKAMYKNKDGYSTEPCYDIDGGIDASNSCPQAFKKIKITDENLSPCTAGDWKDQICSSKSPKSSTTIITPRQTLSTLPQLINENGTGSIESTIKSPSLLKDKSDPDQENEVDTVKSEPVNKYAISTTVISVVSGFFVLAVIITIVVYKVRHKNSTCANVCHLPFTAPRDSFIESESSSHENVLMERRRYISDRRPVYDNREEEDML